MMNFLFDYGMFLAKSLTVAVCLLLVIAGAVASRRHRDDDDDDKMRIRLLNEHFEQQRERLNAELLDKKTLKAQRKAEKKRRNTIARSTNRGFSCWILMAISKPRRSRNYANKSAR